MKQKLILFTILFVVLVTPKVAVAYDFSAVAPSGQTLYYSIVSGGVKVTYPGRNYYNGYTQPTGILTIPSSVSNGGNTYSVTSIGDYAFHYCTGLTSVTIPNSVTSIGINAFGFCSGLTSITIPDSVTSIGSGAFDNCSGLTSVTIGNSVMSIGDNAFADCFGVTIVYFNADSCISMNIFSYCYNISSFNFGNNVKRIPPYLCYGLRNLSYITIPDSVTSIGDHAFSDCSGLTSVTIGNSVTSIGDYAFSSCWGLTSVDIPDYVTSIGCGAFSDCSGLTSVTIPNSVTSIGDYAFRFCSGLTSITIPDSVTTINKGTFQFCSCLTSVAIPNSATTIENDAFSYSGLTSVTIPSSVTFIGTDAFSSCSRLSTVYFNAVRSTCAGNTFHSCPNLTTVNFGDRVATIPPYIFANCIGLTTISIPNSVEQIGNGSFRGCDHITNITLDTGLTTIGNEAFSGCTQMVRMTSKSENPPTAYVNTFNGVSDDVILDVPCNAADAYENAAYWFRFNIQEDFVYDFSATSSNPARGTVTIVTEPTCDYREAQVQANAYHGYHFDHWSDGNTDNPRYIVVLQDTHIVAYFASDNGEDEGIEETAEERVRFYQRNGQIVVEGAEGYPVYLYDVVGRLLATKRETAQEVLLDVPASGAYLVKIGDAPARRIVVRR